MDAVKILDGGETITYRCPRCATDVTERFYGPCTECREALRAQFASVEGGARVIAIADYVPKMNVTPNAVALKDDD